MVRGWEYGEKTRETEKKCLRHRKKKNRLCCQRSQDIFQKSRSNRVSQMMLRSLIR